MSDATPLMQQYKKIKEAYKDYVLLFRLGDFYEFFYQDAIEISALLNLVLTQRNKVPMCGIPSHSLDTYIQKLVVAKKKIAICEQTSQPQKGQIVTREVVDIITPGTVHSISQLQDEKPNYLLACCLNNVNLYCAWIDVSQGTVYSQIIQAPEIESGLISLIEKIDCKELLLPESESSHESGLLYKVKKAIPEVHCSTLPIWKFSPSIARDYLEKYFGAYSYHSLGFENESALLPISGLLEYLSIQKQTPDSLQGIQFFTERSHMRLNSRAIRDLELFESKNIQSHTYTLYGICDQCETLAGKRLLHQWMRFPLQDVEEIRGRHAFVSYLLESDVHIELLALLRGFPDIERIFMLMMRRNPSPRHIHLIRVGLQILSDIAKFVQKHSVILEKYTCFKDISQIITLLEYLNTFLQDPPSPTIGEGVVIRDEASNELAQLRVLSFNGNKLINELFENERAQAQANFRLKFSKLIGYYFEAAHSQREKMPSHFVLRQTLSNYDRYKSQTLQDLENKLYDAQENLISVEKRLFYELCEKVNKDKNTVLTLCRAVAEIDVYQSFAHVAHSNNYVCPTMESNPIIELSDSRHPIIEQHLPHGNFVSNTVQLTKEDCSLIIITGPNMSGKSTILRQTALIVIMAHVGLFVPCSFARIGVVDQVATRIGASDNLSKGESTFLTEMIEATSILRSSSDRSLIIMDEVGRGTSVNDGMSIAQAIVEHLSHKKIFTLFATHYHTFTEIFAISDMIKNYSFTVETTDQGIVFTRKFREGSSNNSYGIEVAALAGMPAHIIKRAHAILGYTKSSSKGQMSLPFDNNIK